MIDIGASDCDGQTFDGPGGYVMEYTVNAEYPRDRSAIRASSLCNRIMIKEQSSNEPFVCNALPVVVDR